MQLVDSGAKNAGSTPAWPKPKKDAKTKALMLLVQTGHIRQYLAEHEPKALEQADKALELEYGIIALRDTAQRFLETRGGHYEAEKLEDAIEKSRELVPPIS